VNPAPEGGDAPDGSRGPECTGSLILIVEDDAGTRELYECMFSLAGFRSAAARTGSDGIAMAARLQPDIILTDIGIPGPLDGCAMTRVLKANLRTCRIPVVALTGYEARKIRLLADFQEVLTKPILPDVLVATVQRVMARARIL
jgi:two-component system, cell cycle response regulator DivK